ncbi:hypothetical protein BHE74_00034577 [Ensete ventricosum]|nr:hypothetical protein BHE74_00034577 [Ensete ventricosum]
MHEVKAQQSGLGNLKPRASPSMRFQKVAADCWHLNAEAWILLHLQISVEHELASLKATKATGDSTKQVLLKKMVAAGTVHPNLLEQGRGPRCDWPCNARPALRARQQRDRSSRRDSFFISEVCYGMRPKESDAHSYFTF